MNAPLFSLSWRGGASERRFRSARAGIEDLPWGTFDTNSYSPILLEEARRVWTNGVFTEYASAAAFSALSSTMLQCAAPIDLVACAADFAVDELSHVELASRLLMEMGGAAPLRFELEHVLPKPDASQRAIVRAAEIVVTTSCVGECLSVPALARSRELSTDGLVRAVLDRIVSEEGPHARLGWWFLDWAADHLSNDERAHLANVATGALETYAPLWQTPACGQCPPPLGLGGNDAVVKETLRRTVIEHIAAPLREYGIELDAARLGHMTASEETETRSLPEPMQ